MLPRITFINYHSKDICSLIEWLVKDSRVRGIEQGPQDGEREEVREHEHRRGKGEEPRIVAEELVEQCKVGESRRGEFSVGEAVDVEDDEAVEEVRLLAEDGRSRQEAPIVHW